MSTFDFDETLIIGGKNFVTAKVVKGALDIKYGKAEKLEMGNLESYRDWGHSSDYTKAMIKLLNYKEPEDIVISTGKSHSVKELCEEVFDYLGLNYKDHIVINKKFFRPEELPYLQGDSNKGRKLLSWEPEYTFNTMIISGVIYLLMKFTFLNTWTLGNQR